MGARIAIFLGLLIGAAFGAFIVWIITAFIAGEWNWLADFTAWRTLDRGDIWGRTFFAIFGLAVIAGSAIIVSVIFESLVLERR